MRKRREWHEPRLLWIDVLQTGRNLCITGISFQNAVDNQNKDDWQPSYPASWIQRGAYEYKRKSEFKDAHKSERNHA